MTGRELRERHEAYERASGTDAAWDLLAGSIEAEMRDRVAAVVTRREGSPRPDMTGSPPKCNGLESDEAAEARLAQERDAKP